MSAGQRLDEAPPSACERDPIAVRLAALEAEVDALRKANTSLQEQLSLRDLALDATPSFFIIFSIESGGEPTMAYCNQAVAQQRGHPREALIGQPLSAIYRDSPVTSPEHRTHVYGALRAGKAYEYESELVRGDGSKYWVGVALRPIRDETGRLTHYVAIGADITAKREEVLKKQELQRKLLAEMQQRERIGLELQLAQKLESVGRLAAGVAHEINTPIQYVGDSVLFLRSAYEDLTQLAAGLQQTLEGVTDIAVRRSLSDELARLMEHYDAQYLRCEIPRAFERTLQGVARVTSIVKAMKEFAHPASEEQAPADINHALETTLIIASNEYKYHAHIHTELSELPEVNCNIGELNQVFLNLIVNAAHAIHDAGKDVTSGEIRIHTSLAGGNVVIRIGDNGCGIPQEHLSKIYDPFFTTKEVGRGTGQGLALARAIIVDKHCGSMDVLSELGVGTEFTVRLPVAGRDPGRGAPP